jgi:hypothetical protein
VETCGRRVSESAPAEGQAAGASATGPANAGMKKGPGRFFNLS